MINVTIDTICDVSVDDYWNNSNEHELIMHSIHSYPAKFPAFIAQKAFSYAESEGVNIDSVGDIFCGCGTVALESKLHEKSFWGCDINPVAVLIAKTKSNTYKTEELNYFYHSIYDFYFKNINLIVNYKDANERIKYWFTENSYKELYILKQSILSCTLEDENREAFLCLFSSILKNSSKWLTKSIKPQIDPNKNEEDIWELFAKQYERFLNAVNQINNVTQNSIKKRVKIQNKNFLKVKKTPSLDLIISSPPYVTSYEYADLHQLSSLWLDYVDDYRELRSGSIGSVYNSDSYLIDYNQLNDVGKRIVSSLERQDIPASKTKSVARYYTDIQKSVKKSSKMLKKNGMILFVVGDTQYKGVKINNSEHLVQCLIDEGFADLKASKRIISNKTLTPYRDKKGRFSSNKNSRKVYHEEFVISGRKN